MSLPTMVEMPEEWIEIGMVQMTVVPLDAAPAVGAILLLYDRGASMTIELDQHRLAHVLGWAVGMTTGEAGLEHACAEELLVQKGLSCFFLAVGQAGPEAEQLRQLSDLARRVLREQIAAARRDGEIHHN